MNLPVKIAAVAAALTLIACAAPEADSEPIRPTVQGAVPGDQFRTAHIEVDGYKYVCILWDGPNDTSGMWCR